MSNTDQTSGVLALSRLGRWCSERDLQLFLDIKPPDIVITIHPRTVEVQQMTDPTKGNFLLQVTGELGTLAFLCNTAREQLENSSNDNTRNFSD